MEIFPVPAPPMTSGGRDSLCLKIWLSPVIKFCVSVSGTSPLSALKALVAGTVKESYGHEIRQFALRTEDGYELLDRFTVGDLLTQGQVVYVDMLAAARLPASPASQPVPVEQRSHQKKPIKKELPRPSQPAPAQRIERSRTEIPSPSIAPATARNPPAPAVPQPVSEQKKKEQKEHATPQKFVPGEEYRPPNNKPIFDTKFKGFAVKKEDVKPSASVNQADYKPIKRRKEAETYDVI